MKRYSLKNFPDKNLLTPLVKQGAEGDAAENGRAFYSWLLLAGTRDKGWWQIEPGNQFCQAQVYIACQSLFKFLHLVLRKVHLVLTIIFYPTSRLHPMFRIPLKVK